jgi:uncharacterized alpha-E superfamily protein
MLSRTADHLYWMSRYMERAENIARFLDVANRLSLSSQGAECWRTVLTIAGGEQGYGERHGGLAPVSVINYAVLDPSNGSSMLACLRGARENAHAVRSTIPSELWEAINSTWLEAKTITGARLREQGLVAFCDWVKERSHLFRGAAWGTMVRDEAFAFARLGTFMERGDNTARLLGVRAEGVTAASRAADPADQLHWAAVLRSVSAYKAYRSLLRDDISPAGVAEMLIMMDGMPRSLHACMDQVAEILAGICPACECSRLAGAMHAELHFGRLDLLLADGLRPFLDGFIARNNQLGVQVHADFLMAA